MIALDRAGIVGDDGPTHNGVYDISILRTMPNMVVMVPRDENQLQHLLATAIEIEGPVSLRYPRGAGDSVALDDEPQAIEVGKAEILREGGDVALFAIGNMVHPALYAAELLSKSEGIDAAVIDARFVKPLDADVLMHFARTVGAILTVEENALAGGFGSAVLEALSEHGVSEVMVQRIGIGDFFVEHGSAASVRARLGLDAEGIARSTVELLKKCKRQAKK